MQPSPPPPYAPPPLPPPAPQKKGVPALGVVGIAAAALIVGAGMGAAGSGKGSAGTPDATQTVTVTAHPKAAAAAKPKPPAAAGPAVEFGDGTYRVGKDIRAGTYRAPGGEGCYWERLRNFKGDGPDSVLANDLGAKTPVVTIAAGDAGFTTRDCGTWKKM